MIYEFECDRGHITEASVPMGTKHYQCGACCDAGYLVLANRILSPTGTTFVCADTGRWKSKGKK